LAIDDNMIRAIIILLALMLLSQPAQARPLPMYVVYLPMVVERPCPPAEMFVTCHMEAGNR
jgi:hypothetical protein